MILFKKNIKIKGGMEVKSKLDFLMKDCAKNAPNGECKQCNCDEKECILNLIETYNIYCDESEEIKLQ